MTRDRDQQQGGRPGGRQQSTTGRQEQGRQDQRDDYRRSLRDTYNPEPQWLRQDRESRSWGRDEADEYGQGRGRYAGDRDQPQGREQSRVSQGGRGEFGGGFEEWAVAENSRFVRTGSEPQRGAMAADAGLSI